MNCLAQSCSLAKGLLVWFTNRNASVWWHSRLLWHWAISITHYHLCYCMRSVPFLSCFYKYLWQGSGWKVVASFEGNFPNRIKQLPLDRHFDINNVKRVRLLIYFNCKFVITIIFSYGVGFVACCSTMTLLSWLQIVLEADGYQPYLISPEKGLRSLIKVVLEMAKEPARLCVDEVKRSNTFVFSPNFFCYFTRPRPI